MRFNVLILICFIIEITGFSVAVSGADNDAFLVDCEKLNEIAGIEQTLNKFERIHGKYKLKMKMVDLSEYDLSNLKVPMFNYAKIENLSRIGLNGIRFLPDSADIYAGDEIGVTVLVSETFYPIRNHLELIFGRSGFSIYRDMSLFDFFVEALGVYRGEFRCDQGIKSVSMFASSVMTPLSTNSNTLVYHLSEIDALLLVPENVPEDDYIETIRLVFHKDLESFSIVFITARWSELKLFMDSVVPVLSAIPEAP